MSSSPAGRKSVYAGTHRTLPPEVTLARTQPLLAEMGITRVANITGLDTIGIPTVLVMRPNSRSLSVSQGKGLTLAAAKISGIMESIEHFHAENIELPLRRASYRALCARTPVVDVLRLPRYVRPFNPNETLLWIEASVLSSGERCHVPFEMVHVDLTLPLPAGSGVFPAGSNGLASGNSPAEAIAHGLWELIERDSVALFYCLLAEQQWLRRVRLESVDDAAACELLRRFQAAKVRVAVWDVTSDVGVAAFFASIVEQELDPFRRVGKASGFGCHANRGVALCRALSEAAQSRLTRISGSRDDIQREDFELIRSELAIARQQAELDDYGVPVRDFSDVPSVEFATFEEDIEWTRERLASVGLEQVLVVDLSRSELPISVVRVLVPGLEGVADVPGYVPGVRARASSAQGQA